MTKAWKQGILGSGDDKCNKLYLKVVISSWSRVVSQVCIDGKSFFSDGPLQHVSSVTSDK